MADIAAGDVSSPSVTAFTRMTAVMKFVNRARLDEVAQPIRPLRAGVRYNGVRHAPGAPNQT